MAGANSSINITELDFNNIKSSLKNFLQNQDTLKDYNYEGSALSTLLDVLAYNTQYNAYYLNMVANEMFLDSSVLRSSVVSHAKLLDYTPKSSIAPTAVINLNVYGVTDSSLTLPAFTKFMSEAIDGVNYTFVTTDSHTNNTQNNTVTFSNVSIKQGIPATQSYTVNTALNPNYVFSIPDTNVDTTSLVVTVQDSASNAATQIYNLSKSFFKLDGNSLVYFLQESINGNYEIYFGDGVLGKKLTDGNIVNISYIVTDGTAAAYANSFVLMDTISGYSNNSIQSVIAASQGGLKETIQSIKFQAPKSFSTQNRAVTKDDYITLIQQNNLGYAFDAVTVWGGEENSPPVYGQVFISIKPTGGYTLTTTQKQKISKEIIEPISILTVKPTIIDPDYNYIQVISNVLYNPKLTTYTSSQIAQFVTSSVQQFATSKLNTFNSTFTASELISAIQNSEQSIVTNDTSIRLQKKFFPNLTQSSAYNLYFNTQLKKGVLQSGVTSSPALQFINPQNSAQTIDGVYIEESPSATGGIASLKLLNPGFNYTVTPTVTILGDGVGATAEATVVSGTITGITITNAGSNYTQAVVVITSASTDTTGTGGSAIAILEGQYGTLRTYYYNDQNVKTVLDDNIGTIDYINGIITLNNFNPVNVDNALGQLTISAQPQSTIINSVFNKIMTIDTFDPNAILVNVTSKT